VPWVQGYGLGGFQPSLWTQGGSRRPWTLPTRSRAAQVFAKAQLPPVRCLLVALLSLTTGVKGRG
jgi:hypothetical protein